MTSQIGVGIVGCGHISEIYLKNAPLFSVMKMIGCADIDAEAAKAKAEAHDIEAMSVDALMADERIGLVLNLTTPQHHVPIATRALNAGKHTFSEKPLALTVVEAQSLAALAKEKGLRVGCAPDTFLGGVHQCTRAAIDAGRIGDVVAGAAFMMVPGHEAWHHNPEFYYQEGGGPLLDMGPYYLTALINLLGPVTAVTGMAKSSYATRKIARGPRQGTQFDVETPTHISGILQFERGANITITTSFDIKSHNHSHIELYGTNGSMIVADPNQFSGEIKVRDAGEDDWVILDQVHNYGDDDYRALGLADMAQAIQSGRPHRAGLDLSLHVLDIMESILVSAKTGQHVKLQTNCSRPDALDANLPQGQLD